MSTSYHTELHLYPTEMYRQLKSPKGGMVGDHLTGRAQAFIGAARGQVGKKTGQLAASIRVQQHEAASYGQFLKVGSTVKHARLHHQGTRPHVIRPHERGGVLVFGSRGRTVVTRQVRHPGTKPNRYLTDNLELFIVP